MIFARKVPEFYIIIALEIFFPIFWGARAPLPPVPYAYMFLRRWTVVHRCCMLNLLSRLSSERAVCSSSKLIIDEPTFYCQAVTYTQVGMTVRQLRQAVNR